MFMAIIGEPIRRFTAIPINEPMPESLPESTPERIEPTVPAQPAEREPEKVPA